MNRSPVIRFIAAALLIVFIVVATFMYGNAQRAKQEQSKEQAKVEEVQKQSEQKREDQKDQGQQATQTLPAESLEPAPKPTSQPTSSSASASTPTVGPEVTQIPTTGGSGSLSFVLAVLVLSALGRLARRTRLMAV
jgi:outer membrane biosynthesis protein TonB